MVFPERFDVIKYYFKQYTAPEAKLEKGPTQTVKANSFSVEFSKVISLNNKTAFIIHDKNISSFSENNLEIFTQNGYLLKKGKLSIDDIDIITVPYNPGLGLFYLFKYCLTNITKFSLFFIRHLYKEMTFIIKNQDLQVQLDIICVGNKGKIF